jgi:NAD(P)-dependent dehydrogenase (short-subunit alcohol dehydrogenase family)
MMTPELTTEDDFELQMGTNHLGHYALTGLLFDLLKATDNSRIVNMSSGLHTSGDIDFDDLFLNNNYNRTQAYANSKLANLYFTYELQRKLDSADLDIKSIAAHPGYTATNLQKTGLTMNRNWLLSGLIRLFTGIGNFLLAMKPEQGTLGILRAATDPELNGGEYVGPKRMKGYPQVIRSNDRSYDEEAAKKLWEVSGELTGIRFDFKKN